MKKHEHHAQPSERRARGITPARRRSLGLVSPAARAEAALPLDPPIPLLVWRAIQLAASDESAFSMACRLFVEDVSDSGKCREDGVRAARLEHAVARATLDAWRRGQGSCESVGSAYAAAGDRVTRARAGVSPLG